MDIHSRTVKSIIGYSNWKFQNNRMTKKGKRGAVKIMQIRGLSQNQLKIVAAIAMLIDHIGAQILPQIVMLRIIGRLAFPIFSYFIYEGFQYTKNRKKYFSRIFVLGILCAVIYYMYSGEIYGNVLITFSFSIAVLYAMEMVHKEMSTGEVKAGTYSIMLFVCVITMIWIITKWFYIDYGIIGVLLPVFAKAGSKYIEKKNHYPTLIAFSIGILLLAFNLGGIQYFSLMSVPLLLIYNGERGAMNLKNFFYWFYPVHLAAIGMLAMAI